MITMPSWSLRDSGFYPHTAAQQGAAKCVRQHQPLTSEITKCFALNYPMLAVKSMEILFHHPARAREKRGRNEGKKGRGGAKEARRTP